MLERREKSGCVQLLDWNGGVLVDSSRKEYSGLIPSSV